MVYSQKRKLRAELTGLSQKEIKDRRMAGEVCKTPCGYLSLAVLPSELHAKCCGSITTLQRHPIGVWGWGP